MLQRKLSFPKGYNKLNTLFKRVFALVICVFMTLALVPVANAVSVPTEADIISQMQATYKRAYAYNNNSSLKGWCGHYVNLQLYFLGINTEYVGGNGNDEYDNYKNLTRSSGGRKIHAYDSTSSTLKSQLLELSSRLPVVTDVLVGFQWSSTSAGRKYGHVLLIHAIIGEYIYFTDSFALSLGGKYYAEGAPIKLHIDTFMSYYGNPSYYTVEGIIWFEDEELTALQGGIVDPLPPSSGGDEGETPTISISRPGVYKITNGGGLHLRSGAGTSYDSLVIMPVDTELYVLEVKDGWGRTAYEGKEGWCSLEYTERTADLLPVVSEQRKDGVIVSITDFETLSAGFDSIDESNGCTYTFNLLEDVTLDCDITVSDGITIKMGGSSLEVGDYSVRLTTGGEIISDTAVDFLENNPFVIANSTDGSYKYGTNVALSVTAASLVINENVALRFTSYVGNVACISGVSISMLCTYVDGSVKEYAPSSSVGSEYYFTTDGIPAKKMGDVIVSQVCARVTIDGETYEALSDPISYSPAGYVSAVYGSGSKLDSFMCAMLNYGTAAQKYFGYNTSFLSNIVIPESERSITADEASYIIANAAPIVSYNSTASINGVRLVLEDTIAIRFTANSTAQNLSLLVWTEAEYAALAAKAESEGGDISDYLTEKTASKIIAAEDGSFTLHGISAKKFADTYYFRLCETTENGNRYDFVLSYSVTTYCAAVVNNGVDDKVDELCRAIVAYSAAARQYFGYTVNAG